jgi:serine carboxypeptidase-like clade 1
MLSDYWANNESVRRALKVVEGTTGRWERCKWTLQNNKDIKSSIPYHKKNSIQGYRSLIFSGDHDMLTPYVGTQDWIRSLNYSIIDKWRPWMILDQVAGYTTTYANKMTFATVKVTPISTFSIDKNAKLFYITLLNRFVGLICRVAGTR